LAAGEEAVMPQPQPPSLNDKALHAEQRHDAAGEGTALKTGRATDGGVDSGGRRDPVRFDRRSVIISGAIVMALVAALMLALWLFSVTGHFLFLILLAWLFAIALEPGIQTLTGRGLSRAPAAAIVGGSAVLGSLILAAVFGQLFFTQIADLVRNLPDLSTTLINWVNSTFGTSLNADSITSSMSISPAQVASWAETFSGGVLGVVGSLAAVLFDLVTVLVFGFYFAADGPHFFRTLASGMPQSGQKVFLTVSDIATSKTGGYVVSKIVLAGLSAAFHGIFFLAIGVPYWLPFALFVGITAQFVPLLGTYLGVLLPVLATVFISPWKALAIVAFAAVYQQIESYVLTPRVSKKTMDVNPAIALGAVFAGAAVWGPIGALIGIPLAAAGVAILDTYKQRYELAPELVDADEGSETGSVPQA
jgi:predicted PurR-regulated permease PerM